MTMLKLVAAAALLVTPCALSAPVQAKTAFQYWAQGRGVYVPSKERLSTFQDDLAVYGVEPPPAESPRYRYRVLQQRYGVVGQPAPSIGCLGQDGARRGLR